MKTITFDEVRCLSYPWEDPTSLVIDVYLDGSEVREPYLLKTDRIETSKSDSPADPFTRTYHFKDDVTFQLTPYDLPITIHEKEHEGAQAGEYTLDPGGSFEVEYEIKTGVQADPLQAAIEEFRDGKDAATSSKFAGWPNLDHETVVDRIEKLVTADAFLINQARTPWCGPAALAFSLAYRQQRRFVEVARSFYETGGVNGRNNRFQVSNSLQNAPVQGDLKHGDWLLLSSIAQIFNKRVEIEAQDIDPDQIDGRKYTLTIAYQNNDGEPMTDAPIWLVPWELDGGDVTDLFVDEPSSALPSASVGHTDEDGELDIELPNGRYTVFSRPPVLRDGLVEWTVEIDGDDVSITLEPDDELISLRGPRIAKGLVELSAFDSVNRYRPSPAEDWRPRFKNASAAVEAGGVAILGIDSDFISPSGDDDDSDDGLIMFQVDDHAITKSDHYEIVDGDDDAIEADDVIEFNCHTWGRRMTIRNEWEQIEDNLGESISGV